MTDQTDSTVTTAELARWLHCTDRAVRMYADKGIISPVGRGKWSLRASVAAVVEHLRAVASQHRSAAAGGDGEEPGDLDLTGQRAMLAKRQRERIELELGEKRGELVLVSEVKNAWWKRARAARDKLLSIPDRIIPQIAPGGHGEQSRAYEVLSREIRQVLEELADEPSTGAPEPDATA